MPQKIRIGVIFGGRSGEHLISLMSARSVLSVLDPAKYEVTPIGITQEGAWIIGEDALVSLEKRRLSNTQPVIFSGDPTRSGLYRIAGSGSEELLQKITGLDVVFPVLHGTFGEDGAIQGLFELADVAYVGSGVLGSSVGMDKALFKDVMRANGVPVVESTLAFRDEIEKDIAGVIQRVEVLAGYPFFVKPANLGSSVGISKCRNRSDLLEGLMDAARYDRRVLIERGVDAREIEVGVLGNRDPRTSAAGEIVPLDDFYSYHAKYSEEGSKLLLPAEISPETLAEARELAKRAFETVDAAGLARVDFLLERHTDQLYVSEINTIPGFTTRSMYPKLWEASGIPYKELVDRLIELAFERKQDRDRCERTYEKPI